MKKHSIKYDYCAAAHFKYINSKGDCIATPKQCSFKKEGGRCTRFNTLKDKM